jgi:DNA polymerase III epsilon subunit-like protein
MISKLASATVETGSWECADCGKKQKRCRGKDTARKRCNAHYKLHLDKALGVYRDASGKALLYRCSHCHEKLRERAYSINKVENRICNTCFDDKTTLRPSEDKDWVEFAQKEDPEPTPLQSPKYSESNYESSESIPSSKAELSQIKEACADSEASN